ncbi:MAG TPA: alpha/beta hydrolase, partial [Stellaceae bacterium]|nr:alpha/beta hydrolase [Stellaceae bacterium]
MADTMAARGAVRVEDVAYHQDGDTTLLARLYRPAGTGPFPVLIDLHGGAWTSGDRLQNVAIAEVLAKAGILVVSLDFRMPPAKRYPATLDDIDAGIGWTRKHAADYGGRPDWVGGFGTSSGGHLILLAAMRPKSPEARLAYVISGWGVLDPLLRYR